MDTTDGVVEAGINVSAAIPPNNEPGRTSATRRGEDSVLIAAGGIDPSRGDLETTPLLAEEQDAQEPGQPDEDDGDRGWAGLQDFDHLPWWRKPSVRILLKSKQHRRCASADIQLCRYSGWSLPSFSSPSLLAA